MSATGQLDTAILRALHEGGPLGGAELSARLGVTRAAVWARIEELRRLGYEIEASPHAGYRLLRTPDLLHADDLQARLPAGVRIGRDIQVFKETGSTNDVLDRLARDGVAEGVVVFAERQTQGRGRLGRRWVSPSGKGLWCSVLLRPDLRPSAATQLTIAAAVALHRAVLAVTGLRAAIKWPNDLLLGGRKCAGILTELSAEPDRVRHLILGLGVNVNLAAADLPRDLRATATSLRLVLGRPVDRPELAARLLAELDKAYAAVRTGRFEALADEWEEACVTLGRQVVVDLGTRRLEGRAEALDPEGALLVRTEHGHLERVVGGDVLLALP
ncbi:MAG TPA: biotin--[acetyl-CoA-carboxylase] ligase [Verrucomicrobiota bacterium]|nr:biotin--[acetyl-CoA-carboxylase] ligase [Verrucomicrobiota bacterium]